MHTTMRADHLHDTTSWELSQQLRRSRAVLGSVLEWLECEPREPQALERIQEKVEDVAAEIDQLVEAVSTLPPQYK
jgi:hypothetical protein